MNQIKISRRVRSLEVSPTLEVMMEARKLRQQGLDLIDFGPGEPDFDTPEPVGRAAKNAIDAGKTHYTDAAGIPELRSAIDRHYADRFGQPVGSDEVLVGCGAKNLLFLLSLALFDPGDRVALFSPYWVSFPAQLRLAEAEPVILAAGPADGFLPSADLLEKACNEGVRAVILNSPCNPSGATIPYREMERFASLVERHDLLLISDECYEAFYYGSEPVISFAGFRQRLGDRLVIVNSFSKKFAMTGWRVGYLLGSAGLLREVKKLQTHDATHTSSISQWAAVTAIQEGESFVQAMREEFRSRRDLLLRILSEIPGVECVPPTGAFYAFPNVEGLYSRFGVSDTRELATLLIREARIATVPGEAFGCPGHLRISYALAPEDLQRGLARLRDLVKSG